jgi:hypothetical protein
MEKLAKRTRKLKRERKRSKGKNIGRISIKIKIMEK